MSDFHEAMIKRLQYDMNEMISKRILESRIQAMSTIAVSLGIGFVLGYIAAIGIELTSKSWGM